MIVCVRVRVRERVRVRAHLGQRVWSPDTRCKLAHVCVQAGVCVCVKCCLNIVSDGSSPPLACTSVPVLLRVGGPQHPLRARLERIGLGAHPNSLSHTHTHTHTHT